MKAKASAVWEGDLKAGKGRITSNSKTLNNVPYDFRMRFEDAAGTNPEELIGAAHAGCFSMALSMILGEAGLTAKSINTQATVSLEPQDGGFAITAIHLDVAAAIPGADNSAFQEAAAAAKQGCPVSKVLNAEITMTARLDN